MQIKTNETTNGWEFNVSIDNSNFKVTLTKEYYEKLTGGKSTPEELIKKSFEFLLEREPKESILSEFDLTIISHYFPEYEETI